jgi:hypothetical protein
LRIGLRVTVRSRSLGFRVWVEVRVEVKTGGGGRV